jgi:hypothetical protein
MTNDQFEFNDAWNKGNKRTFDSRSSERRSGPRLNQWRVNRVADRARR